MRSGRRLPVVDGSGAFPETLRCVDNYFVGHDSASTMKTQSPYPCRPHQLTRRLTNMSVVPSSPSSSDLLVLSPDEALRQARPLPDIDTMALGEVPDDEWEALMAALADR